MALSLGQFLRDGFTADKAQARAEMNMTNLDAESAATAAQYLPDTAKVKKTDAPSNVAAVARAFGDDPRAEYGQEIKNVFQNLLIDPRYNGREPGELFQQATQIAKYKPDANGVSLLDRANAAQFQQESSWFGTPGKPIDPVAYQQYKAQRQAEAGNTTPFDFAHLGESVGLGVAGMAGAAAAGAAGISAAPAIVGGLAATGAYTAIKRGIQGKLFEGDHPIKDFLADWAGNVGSVAMGVIPGAGVAKGIAAGTRAAAIGTDLAKLGVEVAAGTEAGRMLHNAYASSDYGKSNEGTIKGALLEMGTDMAGFIAGGVASNSIIAKLTKTGAAVDAATKATQDLAVFQGGGSPAVKAPTVVFVNKAYEAQQDASKALEMVSRGYSADGNALVYDMMSAAEKAAIPGKGMLPEGNSRLPAGLGNRDLPAGTGAIAQPGSETGLGPIAQPGMDVAAGRPVRVTPQGTAMTMDQSQTALPGNLASPEDAARMQFAPDGSVIQRPDPFAKITGEGPSSSLDEAPRVARPRTTLAEMYPSLFEDTKQSFQKETITGLDLTPRLPNTAARSAFLKLDDASTERALDLSTKGVPIADATSVVVKDQEIATRAAQLHEDIFTPTAPVAPTSKGIARLQSLGYDAEDLARVDPAVIRMAEKLTIPNDTFVTAKKMTAALPKDSLTGEAPLPAQSITPKTMTLASKENAVPKLGLRDELNALDASPPEFANVYGKPLEDQLDYMSKLVKDPELYQAERNKLMRMVLDKSPDLANASDSAILDAFASHPVNKAFNDTARKAVDAGIMGNWMGMDDEGQAIVRTTAKVLDGTANKFVDEGATTVSSLADKIAAAKDALSDTPDSELPWKVLGLLGVAGTAALGVVGLTPQDSQAGLISSVLNGAKGFVPKAMSKVMESANKDAIADIIKTGLKEHYVGVEADPVTGAKGSFMKQFAVNKMAEAKYGTNTPGSGMASAIQRDSRLPFGLDRLFSVGGLGHLIYKPDADPSVQIASMLSSMNFNINKVYGPRAKAIFESVGAKSMADEIAAKVNPIEVENGWVTKAYSNAAYRAQTLEKKLGPLLEKAQAKDASEVLTSRVQDLQAQLDEAKGIVENLKPRYDDYVSKKNEVFKEFAGRTDNPSVRIGLALDDTKDFQRYPWLKDMISNKEMQAVDLLRDMNNEYAARMLDLGQRPISRPYLHYINTPEMSKASQEQFEKFIADKSPYYANSAPYSKMYSREMFSTPIIPDAVESQFAYIMDAERRLGGMEFWGKSSDKSSWLAHSKSAAVNNNPIASLYWDKVRTMMQPEAYTTLDKMAARYTAFEAARLLSFAPSTGAKHLFKMFGQASQMGLAQTVRYVDDATKFAIGNMVKSAPIGKTLEELGALKSDAPELTNAFIRSMTAQRQYSNIMDGFEIGMGPKPAWYDKWLNGFAQKGGVFISGAEAIDRANTVLAAADMAAKQGMTAQQAMYGIYSSIIHNNFLSGPLNAPWMKNPLVKAVAMFQVTPFKIMERRLGTALETGAGAKDAWSVLKTLSNADGLASRIKANGISELKSLTPMEALKQLYGVRQYITQGESIFKTNAVAEALFKRQDSFGNAYTSQFMRDALYTSLVLGGGAAAGVDFSEHMVHVPFMKFGTGETEVGLTTSPIVKGTIKNYKDHENGNDFDVATFFKNYLGTQGILPTFVHKAMRVNDNDVPDIYNGSWMKYFFSVPSAGGH